MARYGGIHIPYMVRLRKMKIYSTLILLRRYNYCDKVHFLHLQRILCESQQLKS